MIHNRQNHNSKFNRQDNRKFVLACVSVSFGIILLFIDLFLGEVGQIHSSVLSASGELFVLAGAILGIDVVYSRRLSDIFSQLQQTNKSKKNKKNDLLSQKREN